MPIKSFFRRSSRSSATSPCAAASGAGQLRREITPPLQDEATDLVVKGTFLHFVLGKRRVFKGRRRSNSDHCAPAKAADSPEKLSSKESVDSRRSVISILATDDERALHALDSLQKDRLTVEQVQRDCHSPSSLDNGLPDELEASFVLTGDERYVHGHGHDDCCCDDDDGLSSTRDDASVFSDQEDGFCEHAADFVSACCDEGDGQKIFSLSTMAPDDNSIGIDACVRSDDGLCEHATDHSELSGDGAEGNRFFRTSSDIAEVLDTENETVDFVDGSAHVASAEPATLVVVPLAVPCVVNVVMQPQPADKRKKSKAKTKKSKAEPIAAAFEPKPEARTTVMLRHLPRDLSQGELLELLDSKGFLGKYDFVYLPMHFLEQANLGYAYINLSSPEDVPTFWKAFEGLRKWPKLGTKILRVGWSNPHQGLEAHVERYRNSPIMHASVPEEIRPLLFEDGRRVAFPPPTKAVRAPRVRGARGEPAFWNA
jgi:hypothetical protein